MDAPPGDKQQIVLISCVMGVCVCVCGLALDTSITLLNNTFCYFGLAEDNSVKVCEIEHREGEWLTDFLWEIR